MQLFLPHIMEFVVGNRKSHEAIDRSKASHAYGWLRIGVTQNYLRYHGLLLTVARLVVLCRCTNVTDVVSMR
jgi:hypothetical protein